VASEKIGTRPVPQGPFSPLARHYHPLGVGALPIGPWMMQAHDQTVTGLFVTPGTVMAPVVIAELTERTLPSPRATCRELAVNA